jgi:nucleotide-binding universal stress UspA family protein
MFKKILVPIDISQSDGGATGLKSAVELADTTGAKLILLHVTADVPNLVAAQLPSNYLQAAQESAAKELEGIAKKLKLAAGNLEIQTTHGHAYSKILEAAKKEGVDLIVIASHQPGAADYLLGSCAAKVVRHAHCSVLVVRT